MADQLSEKHGETKPNKPEHPPKPPHPPHHPQPHPPDIDKGRKFA